MRIVLPLLLASMALAPRLAAAQAPTPVEVSADREGVTLHQVLVEGPRSHWTGRRYDATQPLCTAPCRLTLPAGTYRFALSDGGEPVRSARLTDVRGPTALHLDYASRSGARAAGWLVFGVGALAGAITALAGTFVAFEDGNDVDLGYGLMIGGLGGIIVAGIASLPLVALNDHVAIRGTSLTGSF